MTLQTPGVKLIEHSKVTVKIGTDVLTTVPVIILPTHPVGGTTVYDIGSVIDPLNVSPPVSTTELHDNCVQLKVPVSTTELHDSCVQIKLPVSISEAHVKCAQLKFPEKEAVLGSVVK